jgi:hypothetical protein
MTTLPEQLRKRALEICKSKSGSDLDFIFECLSIGAEMAAAQMSETIKRHRLEMDRLRDRSNLPH